MKLTKEQLQVLVSRLIREAKSETAEDSGPETKIRNAIAPGSTIKVYNARDGDEAAPFITSKAFQKGNKIQIYTSIGKNFNPLASGTTEYANALDNIATDVINVRFLIPIICAAAADKLSNIDVSSPSDVNKIISDNISNNPNFISSIPDYYRNKNKSYEQLGMDYSELKKDLSIKIFFPVQETEVVQSEFRPHDDATIKFTVKVKSDAKASAAQAGELFYNAGLLGNEPKGATGAVAGKTEIQQRITQAFDIASSAIFARYQIAESLDEVVRHLASIQKTGFYKVEIDGNVIED